MTQEMITLYGGIGSLLLAAVIFFLKRTMSRVDSHDEKIQHIEKTYVEVDVFNTSNKDLKESIKIAKDAADEKSRRLSEAVTNIQQNYLTKEDFYRCQAATDKKLDKIYDLILKLTEDKTNGKS